MDDMGKLNAANAVKSAEEVFKSSDKTLEKSKQIIQECISGKKSKLKLKY